MDRSRLFNVLAILCGLWFLLAGWMWVYFFNVIFVFPIAIAGFVLWRKGRADRKRTWNVVAGILLLAGLMTSIVSIFLYR
jgi:hypothetical protein